ncbi:unnamed protein product, partial [Medioppia subpectinata]
MVEVGDNDIRFHNYVKDIRLNPDKWSEDWHKYPGIPYTFFVEDWAIPLGNELQEMTVNYWQYSIHLSIAYIIVIFGTKYLMSFRNNGYDLRKYLSAWNIFLSIFSIVGVVRCLPEFVHILYTKGFTASFCDASYYE